MYEYAPIAKAQHTLEDATATHTKHKFDIAKENLAFAKMGPLCQLEERHGVDLGQGYKKYLACASFADHIAQEQRQSLVASLSRAKFFGLLPDRSTDVGNIEDNVFSCLLRSAHS